MGHEWVSRPEGLAIFERCSRKTSPTGRQPQGYDPTVDPVMRVVGGLIPMSLSSRRILVVGASSGIGAAFSRAALEAGATVTVCARRRELLDSVVAGAAAGHAVEGDATVPSDMQRVASVAIERMGAIDLMVYSAGYGVLQRLLDTEPDIWTDVYRVNVVGANLAAAAALPHMDRSGAIAFVSSRTTSDNNAMFASYSASKAALDQCIDTWRVEHPDRRFIRITMGNCEPTEFPDHMGLDLLSEALRAWKQQAIPFKMMNVEDVAGAMVRSLATALDHPEIDCSELRFDPRPI